MVFVIYIVCSEKIFDSTSNITREEIATILGNILKKEKYRVLSNKTDKISDFFIIRFYKANVIFPLGWSVTQLSKKVTLFTHLRKRDSRFMAENSLECLNFYSTKA